MRFDLLLKDGLILMLLFLNLLEEGICDSNLHKLALWKTASLNEVVHILTIVQVLQNLMQVVVLCHSENLLIIERF